MFNIPCRPERLLCPRLDARPLGGPTEVREPTPHFCARSSVSVHAPDRPAVLCHDAVVIRPALAGNDGGTETERIGDHGEGGPPQSAPISQNETGKQ